MRVARVAARGPATCLEEARDAEGRYRCPTGSCGGASRAECRAQALADLHLVGRGAENSKGAKGNEAVSHTGGLVAGDDDWDNRAGGGEPNGEDKKESERETVTATKSGARASPSRQTSASSYGGT